MSYRGSICLGLMTLVAGSTACRALDRESYSLIVRKPAHRYRKLTPQERKREQEKKDAFKPSLSDKTDKDALPPPVEASERADAPLTHTHEPFRPFAYCFRHESSHLFESVTAIVLAPLEYPVALVADTGIDVYFGALRAIENILRFFLPGDKSTDPAERDPRRPNTKR